MTLNVITCSLLSKLQAIAAGAARQLSAGSERSEGCRPAAKSAMSVLIPAGDYV